MAHGHHILGQAVHSQRSSAHHFVDRVFGPVLTIPKSKHYVRIQLKMVQRVASVAELVHPSVNEICLSVSNSSLVSLLFY